MQSGIAIEELKNELSSSVERLKCERSEDYQSQIKAVNMIFTCYEQKQPLTVDLIKQFHRCVAPPSLCSRYVSPEIRINPGEFRDETKGITTHSEGVTEKGLLEIIKIIRSQEKFPDNNSTQIGVRSKTWRLDLKTAYYQPRLSRLKWSDEKIAKKLYSQSRKKILQFIPARTNDINISTKDYVESALQQLIDQFNAAITKKENEEKIEIIVDFIKSCLRLRPFDECNHRVFVLCVLNFLLLNHDIGVCPLKYRTQFTFNHLSDSVDAVCDHLVYMHEIDYEIDSNKKKFNDVLAGYRSISPLARFCCFNQYRSPTIRALRELANNNKAITREQIEEAIQKDKKHAKKRLALFRLGDAGSPTKKSTDGVLLALAQTFRK